MLGEILIVDDNLRLCKSLAQNFDQQGYRTHYATNGEEAISLFFMQDINVVLLDMKLENENGIDILSKILDIRKDIPVIMITGYASIKTAVQSLKIGAFDYIKKPINFNELLNTIVNAVKISRLSEENLQLKSRLNELSPSIITQNVKMIELLNRAKKLAATDLSVLICGENGTGKESFADLIHSNSERRSRPMLKINCASFPESLLDNELFGHEKGAYTGANTVFKGVFEKADKSSLFLDEIGDMSLAVQAKILRALQNHEIRRLGSHDTILVDVRFVTATNKNLVELIKKKSFREDLYYRLNSAVLDIPPLRDRKEDIPLLIKHFLSMYRMATKNNIERYSDALLQELLKHHWPGNIRELLNVINYASAITSKDYIDVEDLPTNFNQGKNRVVSKNIREEMEKQLIVEMLQKSGYNKKRTAELLNMTRTTLYNKIKKYEISK